MLKSTRINNRIIWIIVAGIIWMIWIGLIRNAIVYNLVYPLIPPVSDGMQFVLDSYAPLIIDVAFFLLMCLVVKKNRFLLGIIKPTRKNHSMSKLGIGVLLGFLTNFFCILCALIHGDIKLYFDFGASQIPLMLFAFICVFFQSTSEEFWCRGFLYERINVHYPLWVAIVANSVLFGLLHLFNPGVTFIAILDIIIFGISCSLLRWYTGSIWTCMGIHTMWNFTQNLIFGLPNSGLVSEASVFHLDAATGLDNLIYNYTFGVEGAMPALLIDVLPGVVILVLAKKQGRLGELFESRESKGEVPVDLQRSPAQKVILTAIIIDVAVIIAVLIVEILGLFVLPTWMKLGLLCIFTGLAIFLE